VPNPSSPPIRIFWSGDTKIPSKDNKSGSVVTNTGVPGGSGASAAETLGLNTETQTALHSPLLNQAEPLERQLHWLLNKIGLRKDKLPLAHLVP